MSKRSGLRKDQLLFRVKEQEDANVVRWYENRDGVIASVVTHSLGYELRISGGVYSSQKVFRQDWFDGLSESDKQLIVQGWVDNDVYAFRNEKAVSAYDKSISGSGGQTSVKAHRRKDGTVVRAHKRKIAGRRVV